MYTMAVLNQKGGVGKTTTVIHLGVALAERGRRVLLVDLDPQAHLAKIFACPCAPGDPDIGNLLMREVDLATVAHPLAPAIDLIRATPHLAKVEHNDLAVSYLRETYLQKALLPAQERYDFCLIDCPPHLGLLVINALVASTGALAVTETSALSYGSLLRLFALIGEVTQEINPDLFVTGILPTRYRQTTAHGRRVLATLRAYYPDTPPIFTPIPETVAFADAAAANQTIFTHAPRSAGALAYRTLAEEVDRHAEKVRRARAA